MCESVAEGGKRCNKDTSSKRRYRRKTSQLLSKPKSNTVVCGEKISTEPLTIEQICELTEQVKQKIVLGPQNGENENTFWADVEKDTTRVGLGVAEQAEKLFAINKDEIAEEIASLQDHTYDEVNEMEKEYDDLKQSLTERWEKICKFYPATIPIMYTLPTEINTSVYDSMLDFDKTEYEEIVEETETLQLLKQETEDAKEDAHNNFVVKSKKVYDREHQKQFEAYQQILKQIRPMGGTVNAVDSDAEITELINTTVGEHYPTEWLNKSNNYNIPLQVQYGYKRSNYYEGMVDKNNLPLSGANDFFGTDNEEEAQKMALMYTKEDDTTFFVPFNTTTEDNKKVFMMLKKSENKEEVWVPKNGETEPPKNENWSFRVSSAAIKHVLTLPENEKPKTPEDFKAKVLQPVWVKKIPVPENAKHKAILSIDATEDTPAGIAYHEFGHRMESVNPNLPKLEKQFLQRRTNKGDTNWRDDMQRIGGGGNEFVHKGDFVSTYVGKEYFDDNTFEVFTTGVEALFAGRYGGLVGVDRLEYKKDDDHRGFTLGALAVL